MQIGEDEDSHGAALPQPSAGRQTVPLP
jgi:hypothetical protein